MKKLVLTILIILFMISIYKDIYVGTNLSTPNNHVSTPMESSQSGESFEAIKVKVAPGDTVLTVVERLNPDFTNYDVKKVLYDFSTLNPNQDPERLKMNHFYFFPKY
jgi:hypothetical protein